MSYYRAVCLSSPHPTNAAIDLLEVCHAYPAPHQLSGISGKLIGVGDQFVLMLEGIQHRVDGLIARINRDVPEAGMTVRYREPFAEERAFATLSITELYLDEAGHRSAAEAEQIGDLIIDLFAAAEREENDLPDRDAFGSIATRIERFTQRRGRVTELAA
ncbi:MAG: BLUF domain-containing protein [Planctomycetota bacterium]